MLEKLPGSQVSSGVKMYLTDSLTIVITFYDAHPAVSVRSETRGWIENRTSHGIIYSLLARRLRDCDDLSS